MAHAYVGFLLRTKRRVYWDFTTGRYEEYEDIHGDVPDPQTGERIPYAYVSLTAGLLQSPDKDRLQAVALVDVVLRLAEADDVSTSTVPTTSNKARPAMLWTTIPPGWPEPGISQRSTDTKTRQTMLRLAAKASPFNSHVWAELSKLVESGALTTADKNDWCRVLIQLCADSAPDFAFQVIAPMITSIGDAKAQHGLWDWCAKQFAERADLVARARFSQAQAWITAGNPSRAWNILRELALRYPHAGSVAVDALLAAEQLLTNQGKPETLAIELYENTFRRITKPGLWTPGRAEQSNFYRIGRRLAELYDATAQQHKAMTVRNRLEMNEMGEIQPAQGR